MSEKMTRRQFARRAAAGSAAVTLLGTTAVPAVVASGAAKPAILGGTPVHNGVWPTWPQWNQAWEPKIVDVLRSGRWCRSGGGGQVPEFEKAWADLLGAEGAVATSSGTTALITALHAMGVDAGDEVIVSPFTFIATYNAILTHKALPVMADTDPTTFTMDPASIESRITDRTVAIMPVHIYGMPCDMDPINAIAKKHNLIVIEDACQAWLAEYRGRMCGTLGDVGCFSFQNSKHIPSGEGGAITSMSPDVIDRCQSYHNCGRGYGDFTGTGYFSRGTNYRLTHIQAMMLLQEINKLVADTAIRRKNGDRLIAGLHQIPGLDPARLPEGSRPVWHLFPMRYNPDAFHGLSRNEFVKALRAEGVPCGTGYHEQYLDGLLDEAVQSRGFRRLFPEERIKSYLDSFQDLKGNRQVCEYNVGLSQRLLLADTSEIDKILEAIEKIQAASGQLKAKA